MLARTVADAVIVADERGCILSFSHEGEHLFGYREVEVLDRNITLLMPMSDAELHDLVTGGRRANGARHVVIGRRKDGDTFPADFTLTESQLGGERLFTAAVRDLTVSVECERHFEKLQDELAQLAHAGELDHLTSILAYEVTQPLAEIRRELTAAEHLLFAAGQPDALLAMASMVEVADRISEVIGRLRGLMKRRAMDKQV